VARGGIIIADCHFNSFLLVRIGLKNKSSDFTSPDVPRDSIRNIPEPAPQPGAMLALAPMQDVTTLEYLARVARPWRRAY